MKTEEYIKEILNNDSELLNRIGKDHLFAISENIKQLRDLIKSFVIISSAIIGFTIPIFGKTELVKNNLFLTGGLLELLVVILYGFFYLTHILQKENADLKKLFREYLDLLDMSKEARNKFIMDNTEENHKVYMEKINEVAKKIKDKKKVEQKPDYALNIIYGAFFIAMVMIILSMTNIFL